METSVKLIHWADATAERIIRERGDRESYVLACGITPSGVVHFGNFREVITVDFIASALRLKGKKVRFIFSWDEFDTFRKIPANMPDQEQLKKHLYHPLVDVPDPRANNKSYAAFNEESFEKQLKKVGVCPQPLYQAIKYRKGDYKEQIKLALKSRHIISSILNRHRKESLPKDWLPVLIYCNCCGRDRTTNILFDGDSSLSYSCTLCGHTGKENLENTKGVKLPWRIDWPMRWAQEGVDFEPGGKDHSSEGGSFTTAKDIVLQVFGKKPPVYLQYEFIKIKGGSGKMSSSLGEVVTLEDVLMVYEPQMVRWIFASYKSNIEFAISFDLDVIKTYEDFDRQERLVFGLEKGNQKKTDMACRVYQLCLIDSMPEKMPFRPAFRHLCNILQIHEGDKEMALEFYKDHVKNPQDEENFHLRANCVLNWLERYAPSDFKFKLNTKTPTLRLEENEIKFLNNLARFLEKSWNDLQSDKDLHQKIYDLAKEIPIEPKDAFRVLYMVLISKEKGPKLAGFMRTIGYEKIRPLLAPFLS